MLTSGKGHTGGKQRREVMFLYEAQNAGKNLQRCKYADYWDISKSYWKFQGSRVMEGKFPSWLTVFWKYSEAQRPAAVLTLISSSVLSGSNDGDEIRRKELFTFSAGNSLLGGLFSVSN